MCSKKILKMYQYDLIIRATLLFFLHLCLFSLVDQYKYETISTNTLSVISTIISFITLVRIFTLSSQGFCLIFAIMITRVLWTQETINEAKCKYMTLVRGIDHTRFRARIYYGLFLMRRMLFAVLVIMPESLQTLQLSLNLAMNFIVSYFSNKDLVSNIYIV